MIKYFFNSKNNVPSKVLFGVEDGDCNRHNSSFECWNDINQGTFWLEKKLLGDTVSVATFSLFSFHTSDIYKKRNIKK